MGQKQSNPSSSVSEDIEYMINQDKDGNGSAVTSESVRSSCVKSERSLSLKVLSKFPMETCYYKLSGSLKWKSKVPLRDIDVWIMQDWGDGLDEKFYTHISNSTIFPKNYIKESLAVGDRFSLGSFIDTTSAHTIEYYTFVPESVPERILYFYMVDVYDQLLMKAKLSILVNTRSNGISNLLMAKSLYERNDRQQNIDLLIQSSDEEEGTGAIGIFNRKSLRRAQEELKKINRANIKYWITNDEIHLAYRVYQPSEPPKACIVLIAQNSIFHDVPAFLLSQHFPFECYVCELRGYGYSGGPRGDSRTKESIWSDVRSFVRIAKFSHFNSLPVFLLGNFYTGGLLLNYDEWIEKEQVDGYILLGPHLGRNARDTWKKETFKNIIKSNVVKPHRGNIIISKYTNGFFKGNELAFQYNFSEEIYAANPMTVDHVSTNAFLAMMPRNPKKQLQNLSKPTFFVVAENDEFFHHDKLMDYSKLLCAPHSTGYLALNRSSLTLLSDCHNYIGEWVLKRCGEFKQFMAISEFEAKLNRSSSSSNSQNHQSQESNVLELNSNTLIQDCSNFKAKFKSDIANQPKILYLEAFDGCPISYQCYRPSTNVTAVVVLWLDYFKGANLQNLADELSIVVYRFDIRGTGMSGDNISLINNKIILWNDVKLSVLFGKKNYPGSVLFVGGHGLSSSLILNYATWKNREPGNAYILISPLPNPNKSPNRQFCSEILKQWCERKISLTTTGCSILLSKLVPGCCKFTEDHVDTNVSKHFIKSLLANNILGQLLSVESSFGIWYGDKDELVYGTHIVKQVSSLSRAPMHEAAVLENTRHFGSISSLSATIGPWLNRVSTSLNPRPSFRLLSDAIISDFERVELIGKGTFGHVWLVRHKITGKFYALKVLNKIDILETDLLSQVIRERDILKSAFNGFVVPFAGSFQDNENIYLLMEFLIGGELYTLLRVNSKLPAAWAKFYAAELLIAITYLHDNGIVYRDLKPENILLDALGHVRVIDFGLARVVPLPGLCATFCGSPFYMAPEMITSKNYSVSVDIWAFGVVLFELLTGTLPFNGRTPTEIYRKVIYGKIEWPLNILDVDSKDLISKLLQVDPDRRLGAFPVNQKGESLSMIPYDLQFSSSMYPRYNAIMKHKFFKGIDWEQVKNRQCIPPFQPAVRSEGDTSNFIKYEANSPHTKSTISNSMRQKLNTAFKGF